MNKENFYANYPTKLYQENFKTQKDRNFHLLAMAIIISWVNTSSGQFHLSVRKLAQEIKCSTKKAKEIIDNFLAWGYLKKISEAKNQYKKSVYKLSTYNWNLETAKETAKETEFNKEYQYLKQNQKKTKETAKCIQTNNNITNNDITNNEIYSESVSESERTPETKPQNLLENNENLLENNAAPSKNKKQTFARENFAAQVRIRKAYEKAYKIDPEEVVNLWNSILSIKTKKPLSMSQLTSKELRYLRAACKVYGKEDWVNYFERLKQSEILWNFESGWKPNIGWALNYDNWGKVVRGDYIPDRPETIGKTKTELIREQNLEAARLYAEKVNQGISFWDSLVCDK